jgi:hypothetical protein
MMTTGERLIRGFKRAGIALAIPCFLVAAGLLAFGGYQQFERIRYEEQWKEFPVAAPEPSKEHGPWEQYRKQKDVQLVPVDYDPFSDSRFQTLAISAGAVSGVGAVLFFAMWMLGWVCAGFARE